MSSYCVIRHPKATWLKHLFHEGVDPSRPTGGGRHTVAVAGRLWSRCSSVWPPSSQDSLGSDMATWDSEKVGKAAGPLRRVCLALTRCPLYGVL